MNIPKHEYSHDVLRSSRAKQLHMMDKQNDLAFIVLAPEVRKAPTKPNSAGDDTPLPGVICFHGSGHTTHYDTWAPLTKQLSKHTAVLFYERRGVSANATTQTPREAIKDLTTLLKRIPFPPPYILLAHSHGGTFAREFLHQHPSRVAGMVLAETGQETPTAHDEAQYRGRVLGDSPLSVIHADSLHGKKWSASAAGVEMQERWAAEDERLKKAQLRLSAKARYVFVDGCGHHVVRDRPDVVEEEVRWVLGNLVPAEKAFRERVCRLL